MNTREELLNDLGEAVNIIRQLANIQQRLNTIRNQYRNTIPLRELKTINMKKTIVGACVLALFFLNPEYPWIIMLPLAIIPLKIYRTN